MVETDSLSFFLSCCSISVYISGLMGNVLVIRIVHKTKEMHTPTNYLLASMAVIDVFTIMMFAAHGFAFSQYVNVENFLHYLVCKASALITTFAIVSSITLTVLTVERYNALLKPLRTGLQLSEDNIKKAIALIWVTSAGQVFLYPSRMPSFKNSIEAIAFSQDVLVKGIQISI